MFDCSQNWYTDHTLGVEAKYMNFGTILSHYDVILFGMNALGLLNLNLYDKVFFLLMRRNFCKETGGNFCTETRTDHFSINKYQLSSDLFWQAEPQN